MKRLKIAFAVLLCCSCFSYSQAQDKKAPYKASYTSSFTLGNPAHSDMILNIWKGWDDNNFDRNDYFADTIRLFFDDSTMVKGKDKAIAEAKKYRSSMTSARSVVHAWVPLYSTDTKENMVCIWGTETDTFPDGKVVVRDLHEVWWINSAGKISTMRQWGARFAR